MRCKHCGQGIEMREDGRWGHLWASARPVFCHPWDLKAEPLEEYAQEKSQTEKDLEELEWYAEHGSECGLVRMARLILKLWDRISRTEDNLDAMHKNQEALSNRQCGGGL